MTPDSHRRPVTRTLVAGLAPLLLVGAAPAVGQAAQPTPSTALPGRAAPHPGAVRPASPSAASKEATLATALSGRIPCSIGADYDMGCGHMRGGRLKLAPTAPPHAHIEIKNIDAGPRRADIRLVDVAGDRRKEAVVIISAYAGGVGWPNFVLVYDGNGKLLLNWFSGDGIARGRQGGAWGAREGTAFGTTRARSVDVHVRGIATGSQCEGCGTHHDVFRLAKGKNGKPVMTLITRR